MITVAVTGAREIVKAYRAWNDRVVRRLQFTVRRHTLRVANKAKVKAPIDEGPLRNSIADAYRDNGMTGEAGTNLFYAPYVEFGTGVFAVNGDGRQTPWTYFSERLGRFVTTSGNRPQPFLLPAFNEEAPLFRAAVIAVLREEGVR